MKVTIPIRTKNPNNTREHWRPVAARAKSQRMVTAACVRGPWRVFAYDGMGETQLLDAGVTVTLTRVGPRTLDTDGNAASLKACRDGVADALGLADDSDPRVTWLYAQRKGPYAVEVEVTTRRVCPTCGQVARIANGLGR